MLIGHAWQDQETGPSGWLLWKRLPAGTPKRLVLSNGHHGLYTLNHDEKLAWLDHYLLDKSDASIASGEPRRPATRSGARRSRCPKADGRSPLFWSDVHFAPDKTVQVIEPDLVVCKLGDEVRVVPHPRSLGLGTLAGGSFEAP